MRFVFALTFLVSLVVVAVMSLDEQKSVVVAIGLKNLTPEKSSYPVKFVISANNQTMESKVLKNVGEEDSVSFPASAANPSIELHKQDAASGRFEKILNETLATNQNCVYEISGEYDKAVISKLCVPNYAPSIGPLEEGNIP